MQRIACYTAVVTISLVCLVGCSSDWSFTSWGDVLPFKRPSTPSNQSISELKMRAEQLERIQQYDVAAELYAEILKQDHNNQYAKQRLTQIQRLKHGLPSDTHAGAPIRETLPVSRENKLRQTHRQPLPQIKPGSPERSRSIASREHPLYRSAVTQTSHIDTTGRASVSLTPASGSLPPWARTSRVERSSKITSAENRKERVPLDELQQRAGDRHSVQAIVIQPKGQAPSTVSLPGVRDAQTIKQASVSSSMKTDIAQVSMSTVLPEIATSGQPPASPAEITLADVQKRLSTHPADPSAIETLVQGLRTENRVGRWEISSTLGVLIQNPDARSLIVDSLSRALVDHEPEMRRQTALVIASLGSQGEKLLPALETRLKDRDESVRMAAAYAIDQIR